VEMDPRWIIKSSDLVISDETLGIGYFGEVRLGLWRGSQVACKRVFDKSFRNKSDLELFYREVKILSNLRHPCIVYFLGVCIEGKDRIIITEYMEGGSLHSLLKRPSFMLDDKLVLKIAMDISLGMNHLHLEELLHRDLTSNNILLNAHMDAKLSDFGLSIKIEDITSSFTMGSVYWMAPEVLLDPKQFTKKSDVYSFAIVLWEIFSKAQNPYPPGELNPKGLANKISREDWRPSIPLICPIEWTTLIKKCWSFNTDDRPSFQQIVETFQQWAKDPPRLHRFDVEEHSEFSTSCSDTLDILIPIKEDDDEKYHNIYKL